MDFTAIDFETATRRPDSACQLAAVRVRGGEIVDQACWLIKPRPFLISAQNIAIHGITPAMVKSEPEFGALWPSIQEVIGEDCLIAHNASFDLGVLIACLQSHGHAVPDLQYSCTRAIARRTWPQQPRFGLKPLSDWLGVRFKHHDALEDSIACAKIALAAAQDLGVRSLEQLEERLALSRGTAGAWGKTGPSSRRKSRASNRPRHHLPYDSSTEGSVLMTPAGTDLQRLLIRAEFIRPLAGQRVVFTGSLTRLAREDAERLTECGGGKCLRSVSKRTDLLVVGQTDERTIRAGRVQSTKEEKARNLIAEGATVRIVSEEEFLNLIAETT